MVGWGALMLLLVRNFSQDHHAKLRRCLLIGLVLWFVIDSTGSFLAEMPGNVLLNVGFLLFFLPPLVLVRKEPR